MAFLRLLNTYSILRITKAKVFPSWTLKNLVLFPILTKFVTISPLIWLCGGTNFELQKIVLGRLQFFIFDKRGVKTKTYFLSTYYIKLTKYLYISFQINLNWAKIESSTTTSILKYCIFLYIWVKKFTKVLQKSLTFSDLLRLKFLKLKLKMPHTGSIEDDFKLSKHTGPKENMLIGKLAKWNILRSC